MTDPHDAKTLNTFNAWNCEKREITVPEPCNLPNNCVLRFKPPDANVTATRYLVTCRECPAKYPWLGDSGGTGVPGSDNFNPEA